MKGTWYVYIVECADTTLYSGVTTDLQRRIKEHNAQGRGAKYTRARQPVRLLYAKETESRSEAQKQEAALKRLSRAQKLALVKKG